MLVAFQNPRFLIDLVQQGYLHRPLRDLDNFLDHEVRESVTAELHESAGFADLPGVGLDLLGIPFYQAFFYNIARKLVLAEITETPNQTVDYQISVAGMSPLYHILDHIVSVGIHADFLGVVNDNLDYVYDLAVWAVFDHFLDDSATVGVHSPLHGVASQSVYNKTYVIGGQSFYTLLDNMVSVLVLYAALDTVIKLRSHRLSI